MIMESNPAEEFTAEVAAVLNPLGIFLHRRRPWEAHDMSVGVPTVVYNIGYQQENHRFELYNGEMMGRLLPFYGNGLPGSSHMQYNQEQLVFLFKELALKVEELGYDRTLTGRAWAVFSSYANTNKHAHPSLVKPLNSFKKIVHLVSVCDNDNFIDSALRVGVPYRELLTLDPATPVTMLKELYV